MQRIKAVFKKDERWPAFIVAALIFILTWALKPYSEFSIPYFLLGNIMVGLVFFSWKMRKHSFWKSAVYPAAVTLLMNKILKKRLFKLALMLSILAGWMFLIYDDWGSWRMNRYLVIPIMIICLPIIEYIIIKKINKDIKAERKNRTTWIMCLYFLTNILLFFFTAIYSFAWQRSIHGPSRAAYVVCMYFVPMMLLVFWGERKHIYANVHGIWDFIRDMLSSVVYVCICAVTLFAANFRIRTILFDLGAPAIGVYDENRLDYISYRLECLRAYFAGNLETVKQLSFLNEHDPVKEVYGSIDNIGLGTISAGWYWLIVLVLLLVMLLVFLARIKTEDRNKKRMMRYLIAGYMLRGLITVICEIFLITPNMVLFPFSREMGMEFMILILFLRYIKGVDNSHSEK